MPEGHQSREAISGIKPHLGSTDLLGCWPPNLSWEFGSACQPKARSGPRCLPKRMPFFPMLSCPVRAVLDSDTVAPKSFSSKTQSVHLGSKAVHSHRRRQCFNPYREFVGPLSPGTPGQLAIASRMHTALWTHATILSAFCRRFHMVKSVMQHRWVWGPDDQKAVRGGSLSRESGVPPHFDYGLSNAGNSKHEMSADELSCMPMAHTSKSLTGSSALSR